MKSKRTKMPIMPPAAERYMAFEGLVQWTEAVIVQAQRIKHALARYGDEEFMRDAVVRRRCILATHSECHFFAIAALKLLEYRKWSCSFGLCTGIDFRELDQFS